MRLAALGLESEAEQSFDPKVPSRMPLPQKPLKPTSHQRSPMELAPGAAGSPIITAESVLGDLRRTSHVFRMNPFIRKSDGHKTIRSYRIRLVGVGVVPDCKVQGVS